MVLALLLAAAASPSPSSSKGHEQAQYAALAAHFASLQPGEVERLNVFQRTDARQALKKLGADYLRRYPKGEHAVEVELNIGRAYYEDGEYREAAEKLAAFVVSHPDHADAPRAAELAFDALNEQHEYAEMVRLGELFARTKGVSPAFAARAKEVAHGARTLDPDREGWVDNPDGKDLLEALLESASTRRGTPAGEKALFDAFRLVSDRSDLAQREHLGQRLLREYPRSSATAAVLQLFAREAAEGARFAEAAAHFEQLGIRFEDDTVGTDGWLAAARLHTALGNPAAAVRALESIKVRRADVLVELARLQLQLNQPAKARALAEQVLRGDRTNAGAVAVIAADPKVRAEELAPLLPAVVNGPQAETEEAAKALLTYGELLLRTLSGQPTFEEKVLVLQQAQAVFQQVISTGSPEYAVAAIWRTASGLAQVADALEAMRPPADLPATRLVEFRASVKEQAAGLRKQADTLYGRCVSRAGQVEVISVAAMGCRLRSADVANPLPARGATRPVDAGALRGKTDAAGLETLGLAYLAANQLELAQLTLARALELDVRRASAHVALGYALLLSGDPSGAGAEYRRALELDPRSPAAHANLSALKCRFRDVEGARLERTALEGGTPGTGPAVDSQWSTCP